MEYLMVLGIGIGFSIGMVSNLIHRNALRDVKDELAYILVRLNEIESEVTETSINVKANRFGSGVSVPIQDKSMGAALVDLFKSNEC